MRECVAALIVRNGKILLGKRSRTRPFYPNIWDVFGGHLENGESPEDALRRELGEEIGISPIEFKFMLTIEEPDEKQNGAGQYHFYLVTNYKGAPINLQPEEHEIVEWFELEQVVELPFAHPLYIEIIKKILD